MWAQDKQRAWRELVRVEDVTSEPRVVAGVDLAYEAGCDRAVAAAVAIDLDTLEQCGSATVEGRVRFGYAPGLLGFREVPLSAEAVSRLPVPVDAVVCDGHGLAHPRGFGLACHLGVHLDVPSIGVAKNPPAFDVTAPGEKRGSTTEIIHDAAVVGACLRTRDRVKPVYVSVGHRLSLAAAVDITLRLARDQRLPESTRSADRLARRVLAETVG